jgi:hypothetical protein
MDFFLPPSFFSWCQATILADWLNTSVWAVTVLESAHTVGLLLLVLGIVAIDLRLLGFVRQRQSVSDFARQLSPYIWLSIVLVSATGAAQFMSHAVKYGHSRWFLFKTILFVLAVVTYLTAMRKATGTAELTSVRHRKLAAYLSLICWCGVAIAEQGIAGLP